MPRKNKTACKRRKCQSQRRRRNNNRQNRTIRGGVWSPLRSPLQKLSKWNETRRTNALARRDITNANTYERATLWSPLRMFQEWKTNRVAPEPPPSHPPPPAAAAARTPAAARGHTLKDIREMTSAELLSLSPENRATILAQQRKLIQIRIDHFNGLIHLKEDSIAEKRLERDNAIIKLKEQPNLWSRIVKNQLIKGDNENHYFKKLLKLGPEIEKLDKEINLYTSNIAKLQSQLANVGKPNRPQLPAQIVSNDISDDDDGGYVVDNGAAAVEQSDDDDEFPELAAGVAAENIGLQQEIDDMVAQSAASLAGINSILSRPVGKVISDAELKREIGLLNLYDPKNQ